MNGQPSPPASTAERLSRYAGFWIGLAAWSALCAAASVPGAVAWAEACGAAGGTLAILAIALEYRSNRRQS